MKQQASKENYAQRSISNRQHSSKVVEKCKKQRNFYIRREVGNIIKKQVKIFFATQKLHKQLQEKSKDVIFTPAESPIQKVNKIRTEQKHKQWEKLKLFKVKNAQRMKKLAEKERQKLVAHNKKTSQNFFRRARVHQKHGEYLEKDNAKIQQLKRHLTITTPRATSRTNSTNALSNQMALHRVSTAKQGIKLKEEDKIGSYIQKYLNKMRELQEKKIAHEIKQAKQNHGHHSQVKNYINKRNLEEEQLINSWKSQYEKKFEVFQQKHKMISEKRQQLMMQRSAFKNNMKDEVLDRKRCQEEHLAEMRISLMKEKLSKITLAPKRNEDLQSKSQMSFFKNVKNWKQDHQKEQHNDIMRQLFNIIQKLKQLNDSEQLNKSEIDFLLKNLGPSDNSSEYKELLAYLNSTKEKFLEQKRKEEQEKAKKNKKNNQKIL